MSRSIVSNVKAALAVTILSMPFTAHRALARQPVTISQPSKPVPLWVMQDFESKTLSKVHFLNDEEIKAAKLGQMKAQRADVREFAEMLERDHTQAKAKVVALARLLQKPLLKPLPETVQERIDTQQMQVMMQNLETIAPESFDTAYLEAMEMAHLHAIARFQQVLPRLKGTRTATLIRELLPSLMVHLERARLLQAGPRY